LSIIFFSLAEKKILIGRNERGRGVSDLYGTYSAFDRITTSDNIYYVTINKN